MEESGSEGLDELLASRKGSPFMNAVDYVCISDNYWLGKEKPCLTYGLRGICYFFVEIKCCAKDLHSGSFGGTVHEGELRVDSTVSRIALGICFLCFAMRGIVPRDALDSV